MNSSHRARWWRAGLLMIGFCGLAAEPAPPDGPNLSMQKQAPKEQAPKEQVPKDDDLFPPRRTERSLSPEQKKLLDEARGKPDPTIEAHLPQRASSILPGETNAIDLGCVLRLAGVNNPDILIARQRVAKAAALRFWALTFLLPNLNAGWNYDDHNGPLQQSSGNILKVNRQAMYVGGGAGAVAAGTVGIPAVQYVLNFSEGMFNYMAIRYGLRAAQASNIAVRNQMFLKTASGYMELVRAESRRSIAIQNQELAHEIARLTAVYAKRGAGDQADADRAAAELADRNEQIVKAEQEMLISSANLAALLNIPPSVQMHAMDGWVVPTEIVPNVLPLQELIFIATQQRPEMASRRNLIRAAVAHMRNQIFLPLSPTVLAGYSAGSFGGGSNLVAYPGGFQGFKEPYFDSFAPREDLDVILFWTVQNMGLGNFAKYRVARAERNIAQLELVRELNKVRDDVAVAYAKIHANYAQIDIARQGVEAASNSYKEDYRRLTAVGRALPIELLNSFRLLAKARMEYLDSVVNYDIAQFALYVALGQPPTANLAHEIPSKLVPPPQPAPPLPGCVPPGGGNGNCAACADHKPQP